MELEIEVKPDKYYCPLLISINLFSLGYDINQFIERSLKIWALESENLGKVNSVVNISTFISFESLIKLYRSLQLSLERVISN